ncbi:hypothetical protein SOVF_070510 [Spinacia oleracea]|uniref:Uncharacterized protein LOC110783023 n=1 Tax=Spinacia oleracea TaxID=3562 RepID=A0A9R0I5F3_SPIOL|nr:uncharacterized protein LOC110783023 [Spinacia oleracea]XP_056694397.1 uncharacterized protein LOC110783023 [Spinacia oleracea]KNA18467.1 hypothetical protein SOVF_070510 [Spinacia oleracea]
MDKALHYLGHHGCFLKFDLVTETFESIPFSIEPKLFPSVDQMVLGLIGECLCVIFVHCSKDDTGEDSDEDFADDDWMFELWRLEEYNNWGSWKRLYRIDLRVEMAQRCTQFLGLTYNGMICIRAVDDGLIVMDPSRNPPSHVIVRESGVKVYKMIDYVESLVSPFSLDDAAAAGNLVWDCK